MTTEVDGESTETQASSFLKRILMRLLLILVGAAVFIAIVQVLRGAPLGITLSKMIWTSIVAGIYGLFAVACANAAERKPTVFAFAGIAALVVSIALFFFGIFFEMKSAGLWKAFLIASLYAVALWRCARFTLATVGPMGVVVVKVTMAASLAIATIVSIMILRNEAEVMLVRVLNALAIVCTGGHVAVPVLVHLHRARLDESNRRDGDGAPKA